MSACVRFHPPRENAGFVWRMEDVLQVYSRAYDATCMPYPQGPTVALAVVARFLIQVSEEAAEHRTRPTRFLAPLPLNFHAPYHRGPNAAQGAR